MRIALVTEEFVPSGTPAAHLTSEVVARLTDAGHEVCVFATGRGQATFRGARIFWASRMTPVSAVREAMTLWKPEVCHLIDPHRLGMKVAEAAERLGVPVVVLDPRAWRPGVELADYHPGLHHQELHDRWARGHHPDGGLVVAGYVGPLDRRKVVSRLVAVAELPGVRLVAVGDGPGVGPLRDSGAKVITEADDRQRACGLASFDLLVQPRKKEVYARSVHEALASGVPVVAYDGGTAADVVLHEHNGLLVGRDRGRKAFARAVARLAASPDLRHTLAGNARDSVSGHSWDDAVAELLDLHYPRAVAAEQAIVAPASDA